MTITTYEKFTCKVCPYTYPKVETVTDISHDMMSSHVMSVPVLTQDRLKMERLNFVSVLMEWTEIISAVQGIQILLRH